MPYSMLFLYHGESHNTPPSWTMYNCFSHDINGLVQERCNSSADTLELHLSCSDPSICLLAAHCMFKLLLPCCIQYCFTLDCTMARGHFIEKVKTWWVHPLWDSTAMIHFWSSSTYLLAFDWWSSFHKILDKLGINIHCDHILQNFLPWVGCDWSSSFYTFPGNTGLILGLRPANERRRYKVTPSLIGWVQS